jgi:ATPase subunit of ABC transporter with duplicated ATPase domains
VKIIVQDGMLNSDEAQAFFTNNQLAKATASGKPATFQQKIAKADKTVNGHSDNIDYDAGSRHRSSDHRCLLERRAERNSRPIAEVRRDRPEPHRGRAGTAGAARAHHHHAAPPKSQHAAGRHRRRPAHSMSVLRARNLAKSYKSRQVLRDLSLEVESGEVVGLLGPNGAGKTTAFYMIVGLNPLRTGRDLPR